MNIYRQYFFISFTDNIAIKTKILNGDTGENYLFKIAVRLNGERLAWSVVERGVVTKYFLIWNQNIY